MSVLWCAEDERMKCPACDFKSDSGRLLEIHYEAVHVSEFLATLPLPAREGGKVDV